MLPELFEILMWIFIVLIGYTYVGYPLTIFVLQYFVSKPTHRGHDLPEVTMIIPTFNEADVIRRKIENSLAIDYPKDRLKIMVLDDDSEDDTAKIVESFDDERIELVRKPKRSGKMASLQLGVAKATSDIIIMSDASPNYEPDAIKQLVQHLNDPEVGIVVGTLAVWDSETAVAKPASLYWKYEAAIRRWESNVDSTVAMHGNLYAIRRTLFPHLDSSTINDEWSISMRVIQKGYRVVYEPKAISYDDVSKKMEDEFKRRVRINAGRYQAFFGAQNLWPWNNPMVIFQIISHKFMRLVLPFFMVGAFVFNILAFSTPEPGLPLITIFLGQALFYALAYLGYQLEEHNRSIKIANIAYYLTISNIAALFGYWRFIQNRQSVMWEKSQRSVFIE